MKKLFIPVLLCCFLGSALGVQAQSGSEKKTDANKETDRFSYYYGILLGNSLKMQGFGLDDVNSEDFLAGVKAAIGGTISDADLKAAQNQVNAQIQAKLAKKHEGVLAEGKKYMEENAKKKEVKATASGIQYEILKEGTGPKPTAASKVTTHYHGTLTNGKVFDSSVNRGQPAQFQVGGVIKGWQEILQLMPEGSKWRVTIPPHLAYGERGAGPSIPPHSTLIFEIELIKIN